jgi:hypothetical protein
VEETILPRFREGKFSLTVSILRRHDGLSGFGRGLDRDAVRWLSRICRGSLRPTGRYLFDSFPRTRAGNGSGMLPRKTGRIRPKRPFRREREIECFHRKSGGVPGTRREEPDRFRVFRGAIRRFLHRMSGTCWNSSAVRSMPLTTSRAGKAQSGPQDVPSKRDGAARLPFVSRHPGYEKFETALVFAAGARIARPRGDACGSCPSCVKIENGEHPRRARPPPDGAFIRLAAIRSFTSRSNSGPTKEAEVVPPRRGGTDERAGGERPSTRPGEPFP